MKDKLLYFSLLITCLILTCIAAISCNAPRNNPLDPLNPDYNYGTIEGIVQSSTFPYGKIPGVGVMWQNSNLITETDANGRFRLTAIPINDGNIIFSKEGYKDVTFQIVWGSSKTFYLPAALTRIPTLDSVLIYTIVRNQVPLGPESELFVKTWITDIDRNLDSVFIYNEQLELKKLLSPVDRTYEATILEDSLNLNNIEETIGKDLFILAKDRFGNEFNIGETGVTRIINKEVSGLHPSTDSTVVSQPIIFKWNRFNAGYDFTYKIELYSYTFSNTPVLIHTATDISSNTTSYTLPFDLPNSDYYYWVIWVIDNFQNKSRSQPVLFKVLIE